MSNAEIIRTAQVLHNITEEVHTYGKWKAMGYQVKRGSKALFKTTIWKYTSRKNDEGETESHMFMKSAGFFGRSQVEKIKK